MKLVVLCLWIDWYGSALKVEGRAMRNIFDAPKKKAARASYCVHKMAPATTGPITQPNTYLGIILFSNNKQRNLLS